MSRTCSFTSARWYPIKKAGIVARDAGDVSAQAQGFLSPVRQKRCRGCPLHCSTRKARRRMIRGAPGIQIALHPNLGINLSEPLCSQAWPRSRNSRSRTVLLQVGICARRPRINLAISESVFGTLGTTTGELRVTDVQSPPLPGAATVGSLRIERSGISDVQLARLARSKPRREVPANEMRRKGGRFSFQTG